MLLVKILLLPLTIASQTAFKSTIRTSLLSQNVTDFIEGLRVRWGIPGISIALVGPPDTMLSQTNFEGSTVDIDGDGWIRETVSFGQASRDGRSVEPDTRMAIASNSKLFTAVSIGLLIENKTRLPDGHLLNWDTKVKDVLPGWQLQDRYASDHVDITDLLSMRSGMPRHDNSRPSVPPADIITNLRHLKPSTELRKEWQYNNHHYMALSHIIPTLTNVTFASYVDEHIFKPLGMRETTYNSTIALDSGKRSEAYFMGGKNISRCHDIWDYDAIHKDKWRASEIYKSCVGETKSIGWWTDGSGLDLAGAGGVVTTSSDLTKWIKELLDPHIIPPAILTQISTSHTVIVGTPAYPEVGVQTYALAQIQLAYRGTNFIGHTGSLPGQHSCVHRIRDMNLGLGVMFNGEGYGDDIKDIIEYRILDHWLGLHPIDWEERYFNKRFARPKTFKPPVVPRQPKIGWDSIAGSYHDEGYGTMELVKYQLNGSSTFSEGGKGLYDILAATGSPINTKDPIYVAVVDKLFSSHLVFTHFDGQLFNWTSLLVYPAIEDQSFLSTFEQTGTAVILEDGIGMFGNLWGQGSTVKESQVTVDLPTVKGRAEVWYEKVQV